MLCGKIKWFKSWVIDYSQIGLMKKLDWYILKKFLSTFVFVLFVLIMIIVIIDFTEKNDNFMKNEVSVKEITDYYLAFMPYMASLLTPIIVFIATVLVTTKMAAKTEIIAILSSGVSFMRFMVPFFIGASFIGSLSFIANSYVIPEANKYRVSFELQYIKKAFYFNDRNIHLRVAPNLYVYMDRYNNQGDVGYNVTLEKIEEGLLLEKLTARTIKWDTANHLWRLGRWERRVLEGSNEIISSGDALDTVLYLSPEDFGNQEKLWETLTMTELNHHIDQQTLRGSADVDIYKIEKYIRFMTPFSVIILTFIGIIVSSKKSRRGSGFQIALGFMIAFVFVIAFILSRALAEANTFNNPLLAVWLPNIIFSIVSVFLYRTVPR